MTVTGYPDWQPGGLALHGSTPLANGVQALNVIPSTQVPGTFNVYQTCYELYVGVQNGAPAGSASYLVVQMDWIDGVSGLTLARRNYKIVSGPNGTDHTVKIAGPVHADTVKLSFSIVSDSVHAITATWHLFGTSRPYARDVMRTIVFAQDGFTAPGPLQGYMTLINTNPSVGAGATLDRLMAAYSGNVHIAAVTSSGISDMKLTVREASTSAPILVNSQQIAALGADANGNIDTFIALPNVQCIVRLANNNAAAKTIDCVVTINDVGA